MRNGAVVITATRFPLKTTRVYPVPIRASPAKKDTVTNVKSTSNGVNHYGTKGGDVQCCGVNTSLQSNVGSLPSRLNNNE